MEIEADALVGSSSVPSLTNAAWGFLKVRCGYKCSHARLDLYRAAVAPAICVRRDCRWVGRCNLGLMSGNTAGHHTPRQAGSSTSQDAHRLGQAQAGEPHHPVHMKAFMSDSKPSTAQKCHRAAVHMHNLCPMRLQGRLTLLMGPPRSGKSLFMQMLAGEASCLPRTSCMHLDRPCITSAL